MAGGGGCRNLFESGPFSLSEAPSASRCRGHGLAGYDFFPFTIDGPRQLPYYFDGTVEADHADSHRNVEWVGDL